MEMMELPEAEQLLASLADQLRPHVNKATALVGIYTGGVWLAERLHEALEISLPVGEIPANYRGEFKFKRTDKFKCLSARHEGSWFEIPKTYGALIQYIASHQLQPTFTNRELYINCDFKDPLANVTEIQMGIN